MAEKIINATRMELTRLKNQLAITKKGYKLLKDKQDEMMRRFMAQIESYKNLRLKVEERFLQVLADFNYAKSFHTKEELKDRFMIPSTEAKLKVGSVSVMTVMVPEIQIIAQSDIELTYGFHGTHPILDKIVLNLSDLLPDLIQLAGLDKKNRILIKEIEKTKRRVNAIEHIIIPEIEDNIKIVRMKISDAERSNTVRVMKSKDLILKKILEKQDNS